MQQVESWFFASLIFLRQIIVLFLATIGVVTVLCWYQNWWTLPTYGTALMWAGVLLIGGGATVCIGSIQSRSSMADPTWYSARSVSSGSMVEWVQQEQRDNLTAFRFTFLAGFAGLLVLLASQLVLMWPTIGWW